MSLKRLHIARILVLIIFMISASSAFSFTDDERLLSRDQAQEDIRVYFELIDQQHGNPYQYISRNDFKALLEKTIDQLPETVSVKTFDVLLSQLNKTLRCGHTTVGIDNEFTAPISFPIQYVSSTKRSSSILNRTICL